MQKPILLIAVTVLVLTACFKNTPDSTIVKTSDLQQFFEADNAALIEKEYQELTFWQAKYQQDKTQHPYLMKIAGINNNLFEITGAENYLLQAHAALTTIYQELGVQNASVLRALAHNHMNLHQFDEAILYAEKAKVLKEQEAITDLLLHDLYNETGQSEKAAKILEEYPQKNSFAYIVRQSKWLDGEGKLDQAIEEMERAARTASSRKDSASLAWTFNMLGDFNGHAGNFTKSYDFFKKALAINPLDAFAAKKIISILINVDQNNTLADQMLKKLQQNNQSFSLLPLEAKIAGALNEKERKQELIHHFIAEVANSPFRTMYRTYLFYLYNDELKQPEMAASLAMEEIKLRPTTKSYDLLMWSTLKTGKTEAAQAIADQYLIGFSKEPIVLYHLHELYIKTGANAKAHNIKKDLALANLELGKDIMTELGL